MHPIYYVQIGSGRNGSDPYHAHAQHLGLKTILIERDAFLSYRTQMGAPSFDIEIGIDNPADVAAVIAVLVRRKLTRVQLVLPGFEIYTQAAVEMSRRLLCKPYCLDTDFVAPDKIVQRNQLAKSTINSVKQPAYWFLSTIEELAVLTETMPYPCVIKPVNSGGGLGVYFIRDKQDCQHIIMAVKSLSNYGDSLFSGFILEQEIVGDEFSIQGVCDCRGVSVVLSVCKKIIYQEQDATGVNGTREAGHIAFTETALWASFENIAQDLCSLFCYHSGAFHIDLIKRGQDFYFLEMGFRLSGMGIEELVNYFYAHSWSKLAFLSALQQDLPPITRQHLRSAIGKITVRNPAVLASFQHIAQKNTSMDITLMSPKVPIKSTAIESELSRHGGVLAMVKMKSTEPDIIYKTFIAGMTGAQKEAPRCAE